MRLLVLRFSAMGDAALITPILHSLSKEYSRLHITLVTRKAYLPFFYNIPGVEVIGVDVDRDYSGLFGLFRLYRELRALGPFDYGCDLHGSLRTKILKFFFFFSGLPFATIVKGRREKRKQTRRKNKQLFPLPHTVDRYIYVFERAGVHTKIDKGPWINPDTHSRSLAYLFLKDRGLRCKTSHWIGIAPFAGHKQKVWPFDKMKELISILKKNRKNTVIFLFGSPKEFETLTYLKGNHSKIHIVAGSLPLEGELALIRRMDIMLAMDSLNMHLASILGVKVLSIWGATHYYSGFGPYGQGEEAIIEVPPSELPCRPCSIFGNKECYRKDFACMNLISPEMVYERINKALRGK